MASIKFIKEPYRKIVIAEKRFDLFMASIASVMDLKNKAVERDSFIEYIVYTANHIDALLRLSIILTNQLAGGNDEIDVALLFQSEDDKPIMEKAIYQRCLDTAILNPSLYNRLIGLYNERNKVIHRFIITDIRVEEIFSTAMAYEQIFDEVESIMDNLEAEQRQRKVGVWGNSPSGLSEDTQDGAFLIKKCDGSITISRSTQDENLLFFFLNLFMELQKKETVPAMDVLEYAKVLKSL